MYSYNMVVNVDMSVFDAVVYDWCYAEGEYRTFCKAYTKAKKSGEYYRDSARWDRDYWDRSRSADAAWDALRQVCGLVNLNVNAVAAVFKSIRRNAQYQHRWAHEARFNYNRQFQFEAKRAGSIESFFDLCANKA